MFRDMEMNNWGVLFSWCFALDHNDLIAEITVIVLCLNLLPEIRRFRFKRFMFVAAVFVSAYLFLYFYTGVRLALPYLLLLCVNYALLDSYLQEHEKEGDRRDIFLWLFLTFCFYFAALFFPDTMLLEELRIHCFALITVIFLPLAFYLVFRAYMSELHKATESRQARGFRKQY
ncbi:MAG: hypothetical protein IKF05_08985 [Erysipelotrichaceae bacterium]|nr:hypothetical protein [Erysipelotrichaceae bacterium]